MKIIITGSLGNISKPLTIELVEQGHTVTVISSKSEKEKEIIKLGAIPAIGSVEDINFLVKTFSVADAVYCMVPPNFSVPDIIEFYRRIGRNYLQAIQKSGIKRVVNLSSYGAHLDKGTGFILGVHYIEEMMNNLSSIDITYIRPTYFYYNLYSFINTIKEKGLIMANFGGEDKMVMTSTKDIASTIAEEIVKSFNNKKIRYVASDEMSCNQIASILGEAIGIQDLKWITITDEQMQQRFEASGMPTNIAKNLTELQASLHSGILLEEYYKNKPVDMGKVKLKDFAKEFANAFN